MADSKPNLIFPEDDIHHNSYKIDISKVENAQGDSFPHDNSVYPLFKNYGYIDISNIYANRIDNYTSTVVKHFSDYFKPNTDNITDLSEINYIKYDYSFYSVGNDLGYRDDWNKTYRPPFNINNMDNNYIIRGSCPRFSSPNPLFKLLVQKDDPSLSTYYFHRTDEALYITNSPYFDGPNDPSKIYATLNKNKFTDKVVPTAIILVLQGAGGGGGGAGWCESVMNAQQHWVGENLWASGNGGGSGALAAVVLDFSKLNPTDTVCVKVGRGGIGKKGLISDSPSEAKKYNGDDTSLWINGKEIIICHGGQGGNSRINYDVESDGYKKFKSIERSNYGKGGKYEAHVNHAGIYLLHIKHEDPNGIIHTYLGGVDGICGITAGGIEYDQDRLMDEFSEEEQNFSTTFYSKTSMYASLYTDDLADYSCRENNSGISETEPNHAGNGTVEYGGGGAASFFGRGPNYANAKETMQSEKLNLAGVNASPGFYGSGGSGATAQFSGMWSSIPETSRPIRAGGNGANGAVFICY